MSSETRKKACRNSVSQPRVAVSWYCWGVREERRCAAESGTARPRFSLPPELCLRDCGGGRVSMESIRGRDGA